MITSRRIILLAAFAPLIVGAITALLVANLRVRVTPLLFLFYLTIALGPSYAIYAVIKTGQRLSSRVSSICLIVLGTIVQALVVIFLLGMLAISQSGLEGIH